MAKGTKFGSIHSVADLRLIQQSVKITPAKPRLNLLDVPGMNGKVDLTEANGVGVTYENRELVWVFALYPGMDWAETRRAVENALNGKAFDIELDEERGWLYHGRVELTDYEVDQVLKRITVRADCNPYKVKTEESTMAVELTEAEQQIVPDFGSMTLIPEITNTDACSLTWAGHTFQMEAGTHQFPEMYVAGKQSFIVSGTGSLTIKWLEGSL